MSQPLGFAARQYARDHGVEAAVEHINDAFKEGLISRDEFSIGGFANGLLGYDWEPKLREFIANPHARHGRESTGDAVDASAFAAITGNQLIDAVREGYKPASHIGESLVTTTPVSNGNLDTQKEPWLSDVFKTDGLEAEGNDDDDEDIVQPGMEYNRVGFSHSYVLLPKPVKAGRICDVTFEMIFADRTRQAFRSAMSVGQRLRNRKEKRILKVVLGIRNPFTYSYGGAAETSSNTYIETNPGSKWVNQLDSTPLTSWADLNSVERLFAQMRDPVTGEPIDIEANTILVMPSRYHTARQIVHATSIRRGPGGGTNATDVVTYAGDDLKSYNILQSKWAYKLAAANCLFTDQAGGSGATVTAAQADDLWLVGNFPQAFGYREVYPLRVTQAPPMNPDEFRRDVVVSAKASEYGVPYVRDPFHVVRVWGHAQNSSSS